MNKSATANAAARSGSFNNEAVTEISEALRQLLADVFCLYLKTKNFHWHMTGSHFRDYHLLLDEQGSSVRYDGSHRRTRAEDRRQHTPVDRRVFAAPEIEGQR